MKDALRILESMRQMLVYEGGALRLVLPHAANQPEEYVATEDGPLAMVLEDLRIRVDDHQAGITENDAFGFTVGLVRFAISELTSPASPGYEPQAFGVVCYNFFGKRLRSEADLDRLSRAITTINRGVAEEIRALDREMLVILLTTAMTLVGEAVDAILTEKGLELTQANRLLVYNRAIASRVEPI